MIALLEKIGIGPGAYLRQADLERMTSRHPFSAYLNYLAYADSVGIRPPIPLQSGPPFPEQTGPGIPL